MKQIHKEPLSKEERILQSFHQALDENTLEALDEKQKEDVAQALLSTHPSVSHKINLRGGFSFFNRRYYWLFLFGRDRRAHKRKYSTLTTLISTVIVVFILLFFITGTVLSLYLVKSALGIDIFKNFSFGIWDWFKSLSS